MPKGEPLSNAKQKPERQKPKKKVPVPIAADTTEHEKEVEAFLELDRFENRVRSFVEKYLAAASWADFEVGLLAVASRFDTDFRLLELSLHSQQGMGIVDVWQSSGTFPEVSQPWRALDSSRFEHAWWQATQEVRERFAPDVPPDGMVHIERGGAVRYLLERGLPEGAFPENALANARKPLQNHSAHRDRDHAPSDGYFSSKELSRRHSVGAERLRKRLDRWRENHFDGHKRNEDRRRNECGRLYQESEVMSVIEDLKHDESRRRVAQKIASGKPSSAKLPVLGRKRPANVQRKK